MSRVREVPTATASAFLDTLSFRGRGKQPWQRGGDGRDWLFRGVSDIRFALQPSALRPGKWMPSSPDGRRVDAWRRLPGAVPAKDAPAADVLDRADWTHRWQVRAEQALIWRFMRMTDTQGLPLPIGPSALEEGLAPIDAGSESGVEAWPPRRLLPLIALAQHYAVPSRLLDWSRKPLVAAYFAAAECAKEVADSKAPPEAMAVWVLNRKFAMAEVVEGLEVTWAPRADNPNLHLQSGLFTLLRPPIAADGVVERAAFDLEAFCERARWADEPVLFKVTLPATEAGRLLSLLRDDFIQASTVYAGFEGAAKSVLEHRLRR